MCLKLSLGSAAIIKLITDDNIMLFLIEKGTIKHIARCACWYIMRILIMEMFMQILYLLF